ncbi:MAG: LysE family transporter [Bacteroidaceae bacterium]
MIGMQLDIIELLFKGLLIGLIVSAPMGPVGVLCIQRTMNKGRWYGFVTGLGATFSDLLYALLTSYGMNMVYDLIKENQFILQIVGSVMLLLFGFYTYKSNPVSSMRIANRQRDGYIHNFITAFFVTLSNPLIIFLYVGLFSRFSFVLPGLPLYQELLGDAAIVTGAICWWLFITAVVNKVRDRFNPRGVWMFNRIIGGVVIIAAAIGFCITLYGGKF